VPVERPIGANETRTGGSRGGKNQPVHRVPHDGKGGELDDLRDVQGKHDVSGLAGGRSRSCAGPARRRPRSCNSWISISAMVTLARSGETPRCGNAWQPSGVDDVRVWPQRSR
jgi:hypothetical protein